MSNALGLIGLCRRAGRIVIGDVAATQAARAGKAFLVLMCGGAAENLQDRYMRMCAAHGVALRRVTPNGALGDALGKPGAKVAAVLDEGFAKRIAEVLPLEG